MLLPLLMLADVIAMLADGIAIFLWLMLLPLFSYWQMFQPYLADVIAINFVY